MTGVDLGGGLKCQLVQHPNNLPTCGRPKGERSVYVDFPQNNSLRHLELFKHVEQSALKPRDQRLGLSQRCNNREHRRLADEEDESLATNKERIDIPIPKLRRGPRQREWLADP